MNSATTVEVVRLDSVGPTIGAQVASRAALAVAVAGLIVVAFITWAFRGVEHAFRYGVSAIIAMIHDVLVVIQCRCHRLVVADWQMDALFLTALLTVIGFSVQDKIVVFDRIRENTISSVNWNTKNSSTTPSSKPSQRSINTQLMTVEFLLLALALFGGITLREFSVILLVGLLSGTYSSIFIAAPILSCGKEGMAELVRSRKEQIRSISNSLVDKKRRTHSSASFYSNFYYSPVGTHIFFT